MSPVTRLLFLMMLLAGSALPSRAQNSFDLFSFRGVEVDRSASSASVARRLALEDAQRLAWDGLIGKLVAEGSASRLPQADTALMQALVRAVDVRDEKSSATRYIATLDVAFDPNAVRELFIRHGVLYAESGAGLWLLLPIFEADGATDLLGSNDWRNAVERAASGNRLIAHIIPRDSLDMRRRLSATAVANADSLRLSTLATSFEAAKAARLSVRLSPDYVSGREQAHWHFDIAPLDQAEGDLFRSEAGVLIAEAGETRQELLDRLAERLLRRFDEAWKSRMLVAAGDLWQRRLIARVETLDQWLEIRRRLHAVALIRSVAVERIALPVSSFQVQHLGDEEQFALSLASARLRLQGDSILLAGE